MRSQDPCKLCADLAPAPKTSTLLPLQASAACRHALHLRNSYLSRLRCTCVPQVLQYLRGGGGEEGEEEEAQQVFRLRVSSGQAAPPCCGLPCVVAFGVWLAAHPLAPAGLVHRQHAHVVFNRFHINN
jgi:hypothetical protein